MLLIKKACISQDKFLDLFNLVLTTISDTFVSNFSQQTDGVAIGGLASSNTAEIFMQHHEKLQYLRHYTLQKFVDDVCSILKRAHLEIFFHHIDNIHQNRKFTMEEKSNGELAFLGTEQRKDLCIST